MDVLSDVLRLLRPRANVFFKSSVSGTWTLNTSGSGLATFHLIARGACWLHMPERAEAIALRAGDLLVFPRDAEHTITSDEQAPDLPAHGGLRQSGESGPDTGLVCGHFAFDSTLANPILRVLPEVMHIQGDDPANANWLGSLMRFMATETESAEPGGDALIDKLADVLFIQVLRTHIRQRGRTHGLLAALAEPRLCKALESVHADPGHAWRVEILAETAGMSRSAFAKRFQDVLSMSPMNYVNHWRMQLAHERLSDGSESVAAIADELGYGSESSFRKAFKQHMGVGPGAVRRRHLQHGTDALGDAQSS